MASKNLKIEKRKKTTSHRQAKRNALTDECGF